ncbi:MAG: COX15/CtaA family protein, partial [Aurantimicrobium sp.]
MSTLVNWFPTTVDRKVRIAAWTTFVVQILIVVTGGAVRLTASGLGCPTWPTCTEDSLVNTPEMGIHGIIEFGNRLLTFLLVIVAIVTFALVFRMRKNRRDFFWLTLL